MFYISINSTFSINLLLLFVHFILEHIVGFFSLVKDLVIIGGVIIALLNYKSQVRQRAIDNSASLLNTFKESLREEIEMWKVICSCNFEGCGAEPNHFLVYDNNNKPTQIAIADLFVQEGSGLLLPDSKLSLDDEIQDLKLGDIRRITERLNLIAYEILYGNVDIRNIYYEIGQIMDVIYIWIQNIENQERKQYIQSFYPYFVKVYQQNEKRLRKVPRRSYITFD